MPDLKVRSGQVRFITRPKYRLMRAKRKKRSRANRTKVPKSAARELLVESASDRAMPVAVVMNLESFGVDGVGYDETGTEPPSSANPQ